MRLNTTYTILHTLHIHLPLSQSLALEAAVHLTKMAQKAAQFHQEVPMAAWARHPPFVSDQKEERALAKDRIQDDLVIVM